MTLSAVLLAGGASRRMGTDKAQISFEGEPLWQRQLRFLRCFKPREIFISARKKPAWALRDVEVILDEPPSRGPMSGICRAVALTRSSHLLVVAVDMPFLLKEDFDSLLCFVERGRGVVPVADRYAEPLAAIYPKESAPEFEMALSNNNTSMQSLVRQLTEREKVKLVELSAGKAKRYRSINTSADLSDVF